MSIVGISPLHTEDFERIRKQGTQSDKIGDIKIIDAINVHEDTKRVLEDYSKNENKKLVKPLTLIAAKNIDHARELCLHQFK